MTPAQVLATIRNQVYETSAAFYTDEEIYSYMWQAEQEIAEIVKCTEKKDTTYLTSVTGTETYRLPSDVAYLHRIEWDGVKLKKIDFRDRDTLDFNQYGSTIEQGSPTCYYEWGADVGLYPIPDSAKNITLYYYSEPAEIDATSKVFTIPNLFNRYIADYALYRMYAKDQDDGRAKFHLDRWEMGVQKSISIWSTRMNEDMIRVVKDSDTYPETELGMI